MSDSLGKSERLDRRKVMDRMFAGEARSFAVFPLRVLYMPADALPCGAAILISVPKRRLKHAVDRNHVKRLVREAYRTQKHDLLQTLADKDRRLAIAFLFIGNERPSFALVQKRVRTALARIEDNLRDA